MKVLKQKTIILIVAGIIFFIALAIFYATAYPSHLLWQEQNQIFLNTPQWIAFYFNKPAWLGCLGGEWLTQFYHHTVAGAMILTSAIVYCLISFAMVAIRLTNSFITWILTGLLAILLIGCSLSSATTLAFFLCVGGGISWGLVSGIRTWNGTLSSDLSPLLVILSYWTFGFGAILTTVIIILFTFVNYGGNKRGWCRWVPAMCAIVFCFGMPCALCDTYALPYRKALLYPGVATPSLPQTAFERRLAISDAFYRRDYNLTKQLARKVDSPDDITAFYYYLSSGLQDSLPDCLLKYPVKNLGTLTTIGEKTPLMIINMMNDLYYELGDMTYAERAAMMRNVFSPRNRNVRMIKRLAEINLVSGDTLAALKYLRMLEKTYAYSSWSRNHTPGTISPDSEIEMVRRRALSNNKDNIRLGDNCRHILLELLESNPDNKLALDYLLCTDLLLKDMDTFKLDYDTYCMSKGSPRYKDLYQQALMIYLAGTGASQEEWNKYIVPGPMVELFNTYSNRRGDARFNGTYWYYFDKQ